eukprot:scaffold294876_cov50-Prasinocladus_malaysianus.AAC.1
MGAMMIIKHIAAASPGPYVLKKTSMRSVARSSSMVIRMSTGRRFSNSSTPVVLQHVTLFLVIRRHDKINGQNARLTSPHKNKSLGRHQVLGGQVLDMTSAPDGGPGHWHKGEGLPRDVAVIELDDRLPQAERLRLHQVGIHAS